MGRFKDQAICIRHLDWSETSQIVVLMTQEQGKVRGLAKGSKRSSPSHMQRFSGGIELLTRGEILGVTRQSSELATLTEWDLQDDYHHLRENLKAQWRAMYAADLTNALLADLDPHPRIFEGLRTFLEALREVDELAQEAALLRFQWVVLDDAGYRPEVWEDVHGRGPLPPRGVVQFDPRGGGLTVSPADGGDWRVRPQTVQVLRQVASGEAVTGDLPSVQRANRLLAVYVRWILDRELPTMKVIW